MKKNNILYVIGLFMTMLVSQASGMLFQVNQVDGIAPIDVAAVDQKIKDLALPEDYVSQLEKKLEAMKDYIGERTPSFLHAISLGIVATVGTGDLTGGFKGVTPYLFGGCVLFTTYLVSRYFSESADVVYYRLAHSAYKDLWKKNKDLLSLQTPEQVDAYILVKYSGNWPLVDALADGKRMLKSCGDILASLEKAEKRRNILPEIKTNCTELRKIVKDSQKTLSVIVSFILRHPHYKDQQRAYDASHVLAR